MSKRNIEAVYPLSPMQEGMLFHSLYAPDSGVYVEQMLCALEGDLDVACFERAWQYEVERHPILRTAFAWKSLDRMFQVAHRQVPLELEQQDWRELAADAQRARLEEFIQTDRRRGFDVSNAPLMRLALLQVSDASWQFLWTHHHALLDGWSVPLLLKEVLTFYDAARQSQPIRFEPARPYRDYIAWLQKQDPSQAEAFWRARLKGVTVPTPLVVDRTAHGAATDAPICNELKTQLTQTTTRALQTLARQEQLTLNTLVQGAWALLLSRYSGEDDVVFGATVSGRPADLPGAESMVGLFINTLPVRVQTPPDAPLVPWLKALQTHQVEMRQFEYSPLVQIQGWSDVPRGTPMFESIVVFENYPVDDLLRQPEKFLKIRNVRSMEQTNYPLTVVSGPGEELVLKISFDSRRFDADTIVRMLGHLRTLLEGIAANPEQRLAQVPLLTEAERHQLLVEWNETAAEYPHDQCLHQLFEQQVERTPDAVAVIFDDARLTYAELNARANRLAHYLQKQAMQPETLAALCVERSPEMIVGILGVLKAGWAYVPLDPTYPSDRLAFMLQDSQARVLLSQKHLVEHLPADGLRVVCLDVDWDAIAHESAANPVDSATPDNLAYVIYTSGSTGKPKGTLLEHRGVSNFVTHYINTFQVGVDSRVLQFASISFDASIAEILTALLAGATLCLTRQDTLLSMPELTRWLRDQAVTLAILPPTVLRLIDPDDLPALDTLVSAGESCTWDIAKRWARGHHFFNGYGPTEATIGPTLHRLDRVMADSATVPIGRPISNMQAYVLDSRLQPVPIGVPGELHIGGVGLARGYLNRPELTAEKFIRHPFSDAASTRLYKTGDLARYRTDGTLEFIGRADHQIKIRGFRVELGEIEAVMVQHPAVREAVVHALESSSGQKQLVAYIVPKDPASRSSAFVGDLRAHVKSTLPDYMVPSAFMLLDALPRLPNGKVDWRALPAPDASRPEMELAYVAPRTPAEELLAGIWAQVLGVARVGVHDNFFDLGGHSLLATQVVSRVREAFGIELPLRALFEAGTVAQFAERVEAARQTAACAAAVPIQPAPRDSELPLSFAQQRLWFLDQLEPGNLFYNIPMAVRLTGTLDANALERALNEIVRRHESLRTTFAAHSGKPAQVIAPQLTIKTPIVDLRRLPASEREAEAMRLASEDARKPFDLNNGPLLRAQLLRLDEQDHIALLTLHHIVSDGWSMGVLVRELAALYDAFAANKPSPLPDLPIQYADFANWQREWLQGDALAAQMEYWKQQLRTSPPMLELPTDRPRPAMQTFNGAQYSFAFPKTLADAVNAFSRRENVTLFMTLLAAFQTLLHRYTGQEDIGVGTPIANRTRAEIENLIGFFVNTLVLRGDLAGAPSFRELVKRARETAMGAYAHQDLPFEMLVEALQPQRDLSHTPLFQIMFVLDNAPRQSIVLPGLTIAPLPVNSGKATFDLTLALAESPQGLTGYVEYNTDLFDAETIERMVGHFQTLLESVVANPDQSIAKLAMLTPAERQQILVEWNQTAADFPRGACIHELFEQQVAARPDAIAVIFEDEQLTYAELNARANQVARYLQTLGVKPETLVGISAERSLEMVVGILGILKAGGAYLPLDPYYPAERLAFMLEDSGAPLLLTQAHLVDRLPAPMARVVRLDADWDIIARESSENIKGGAMADSLAYVIYTSGSTGKPKGTMLRHRGLCNLATWQQRAFDIEEGKRVLQFSPLSFDASVWETFMALRNGGALVLARQETLASAPELVALMRDKRVTTVTLPPSVLAVLPPEDLPDLETIISAGEACSAELVKRWALGRRFFDAYGPTETTVCASMAQCDPNDSRAPTIGRPIANTRLYILDAHLQPAPVGVPGELCVAGVSLARGYLNRPEMTNAKFIRDPFSQEPGARLYRTGDLTRYRRDGNIEFLGRIDDQVKVRGFRIELGEVESALRQHAALRDAAVVAREDAPGDKRLVAYVVPHREPAPSGGELKSFLKQQLPEYMVPSIFMAMASLPLSPSGKVDRRALPAPDMTRPELAHAYVPPRNSTEEKLAALCAELLGVDRVGVYDSFFDLGGHSLLATQFISRVRDDFRVELPLRNLFETPTISELATSIGAMQAQQSQMDKIAQMLKSVEQLSPTEVQAMLEQKSR